MNRNLRQCFAETVSRLQEAGLSSPSTDAWRLLQHSVSFCGDGIDNSPSVRLDEASIRHLDSLVTRRIRRQPVSQIIGTRWFYDHQFEVNEHVLDPRPDSELLVDLAISYQPQTVLDLGTGSGCLLLSVLAKRTNSCGVGVDCCERALSVARTNACRLHCADRAKFKIGNWLDGVEDKFDVVLANPPYVSECEYSQLEPEITDWEPKFALTPGGDGLDAYRAIASDAHNCLADNGHLIVEIGPKQTATVASIFASKGLQQRSVHFDLDKRPRALVFS